MFKKFKKKNKIFQSYKEFYSEECLKDPATTKAKNLTIEDFNARGEIVNPPAPCVVTTIDAEYIKNAALKPKIRRFRMKTDILTLREITRKKFMTYATQQRYFEKQREAAYQERIYKNIVELQEFAADSLRKSESRAFREMKQTQQKLENLETNKISTELKKEIAEHQRVLMEVQDIYGRFLFLLKLIGYFDDIIAPEDIKGDIEETGYKLPQPTKIVDLQINERSPILENEVSSIVNYMKKIVRPYLDKRNHLNADIWIKGYERTRQKIFNYNRRFQNLALLNHLVEVVHCRSEKTLTRSMKKENFLKDPQFLEARNNFLNQRSLEVLENFMRNQKKDLIQIKLNAILPVVLESVEKKLLQVNGDVDHKVSVNGTIILKSPLRQISDKKKSSKNSSSYYKNTNDSSIENVEKLQWHLMSLIQDLEKIPPDQCKKIENQVRKRIRAEKDMSRRVLLKQNRLHSWMDHFKKHALL